MNRLCLNMEALNHNLRRIDTIVAQRGGSWTLVTKVLCGHRDILSAVMNMGVVSVGDTRLDNLRAFEGCGTGVERWYLRVPHLSIVPDVVRMCECSLNSEIETIRLLDEEAGKLGKRHKIIVMIELGDLREGVLPGSLVDFYNSVFSLPSIDVLGIGANLGCLSGTVPSVDHLMQLVLYRELLELKFGHSLPFVSAGTSAILGLLDHHRIPPTVNHWRIGESAFLGTDLINGGTLDGFRDDTFILEAEIAEVKQKSMVPLGEAGDVAPFEGVDTDLNLSPGERGRRALITVGELDTDVRGLTPLDSSCRVVGASSDISVVHIDNADTPYDIGDNISFKLSYSALLRLMNGRYIPKVIQHENSVAADQEGDSVHTAVPNVRETEPDLESPRATARKHTGG